MTAPFACVPICWTFAALAIVGVIAYLFGAGRDGLPEAKPGAPFVMKMLFSMPRLICSVLAAPTTA